MVMKSSNHLCHCRLIRLDLTTAEGVLSQADITTKSDLALTNVSRFNHASCVIGNSLLIHGGWHMSDESGDVDENNNTFLDEALEIDMRSFLRTPRGDLRAYLGPRFGHSLVYVPHLSLVVSLFGHDGVGALSNVHILQLNAEEERGCLCKQPQRLLMNQHHLAMSVAPSGYPNPPSVVSDVRDDSYEPVSLNTQVTKLLQSGMQSDITIHIVESAHSHMLDEDALVRVRASETEANDQSGCFLPAHKCILACRSEVFAAMLNEHFKEGNDSNRILRVEQSCPVPSFSAFLHCMYGAPVVDIVDAGNIMDVLQLSEQYQVLDIKFALEKSLCMQLNIDNAVDLLQYAEEMHCPYLLRRCISFLQAAVATNADPLLCQAVNDLKLNNRTCWDMIQPSNSAETPVKLKRLTKRKLRQIL